MTRILHTEASPGWGGQELRILRESEGMRARGHEVIFAVQKGGGLVEPARKSGFIVYEVEYKKSKVLKILFQLWRMARKHKIEVINTHSSLDAWLGGILGRISGRLVIRTRHLSTPIRKGMNSRLLYNSLADYVVTTCEEAQETVRIQADLSEKRCISIPTGVDPEHITYNPEAVTAFRKHWGVNPGDCLAGTLCVLRGWKGIAELLHAAKLLEHIPHLKWVVVGGGVGEEHLKQLRQSLALEERVIFTGHISPPFTALAALDIFLLLSWANEGVSQASLQAAWLEKPLITTPVGGLPEVCLDQRTGIIVPKHNPQAVATAVLALSADPALRLRMGREAKELVKQKFLLKTTLDKMEELYRNKLWLRGN